MRKVLRTTALLLAAMLAGYVGGLLGQARHSAQAQEKPAVQEEVRAKAFVLVDDAGKLRGEFRMFEDGRPYLRLSDAAGKERGAFELLGDGNPTLVLHDATGKLRGMFDLVDGEPFLGLWDAEGKPRGTFDLSKDGSPRIRLWDAEGAAIWKAP